MWRRRTPCFVAGHCLMHASAVRAPVDAHPLSALGDRDVASPSIEERAPPAVDSAPAPLALPPAHVQSLFAHTDAEQWASIAHLPNQAASLSTWLEQQDCTTQAIVSCLAQALYPYAKHTIEATLQEALSHSLTPMPETQKEGGRREAQPASTSVPPVEQVMQWVVALAHAQVHGRPEEDMEASTHSALDLSTSSQSPPLLPSPPVPPVELAPMVPSEARPPTTLPPPRWRADQDSSAPVFVDPYGFVYGMTVSEYRKYIQGEAVQELPAEASSSAAEQTDLIVAPLPAPWCGRSTPADAANVPVLQHVQTVYEEQQKERLRLWDDFVSYGAGLRSAGNEPDTLWHTIFQSFRSIDRQSALVDRRWRQFLHLCEQGIPMRYRPAIWAECTQAHTCAEPGEFQALQARPPIDAQIDLDVNRTMPTNLFFSRQGPGVAKLRRILHAYTHYNPTCGYCQGMNNLAAILLLTYSNEEDAFWTLVGLIDHVLPPGYYASDMLVPRADQSVLVHMVHRGQPKLAAHMKALRVELPAVTCAWFLSVFTSCLPMETLFRVWDLLMVDGSIALFRVAYAILIMATPSLLTTHSAASFYQRLRVCTAHLFGADELIQTAVSLRDKVRVHDVKAWRARHLTALKRHAPS